MSRQINLFNPGLRRRRELVSAANLVLGVVIVLLGVGLAYAYFEFEVARLQREAAEVEAQLQARQDEFAKLSEQVARIRRSPHIDALLAQRERELSAREEVLAALGAGRLGVTEGFSGILRSLARQKVDGLWLTTIEVSAGGGALALRGRMMNPDQLPVFVRGLDRETALEGRSFHTLEVRRPTLDEVAPKLAAAAPASEDGKPRPAPYLEFDLQAPPRAAGADGRAGPPGGGA